MTREPFGLDPKEAVAALAAAGMIVTRTEKRDGKIVRRSKLAVNINKATARCVCLRADLVLTAEEDREDFPF